MGDPWDPSFDHLLSSFMSAHKFLILNIRKMGANIRHKNSHNTGPRGPPWPEFGMYLSTISPKVFSYPKDPFFFIKSRVFEGFGGVIKMHNPNNRAYV